jgi:hypothetical protein
MTLEQEQAFITAHRATCRGAAERFRKAGGSDAAYRSQPFLRHPLVRSLAEEAVSAALGRELSERDTFPAMLWCGGATDTEGGYRFTGTIGDFVRRVLVARSVEIAPKRCGWVSTPTSNRDGRRVNASTTAMHALNLDCDGRGEWETLRESLDRIGLYHIFYQSGGYSPDCPKWHVLLPLCAPFDTSCHDKIEAWKDAYEAARVAFGALAGLCGEGFDPSVETPCVPVFLTERRSDEAPPRVVLSGGRRALDLTKLAAILPRPDRKAARAAEATGAEFAAGDRSELGQTRLSEIASALIPVTNDVPSGRRELYLALPGVLLRRGLHPDDVLAVVAEVSRAYPRPDSEKHKDNLHNARTTIGRWERGEPFTQIGRLSDLWPAVARALDAVLPDPLDQAARDMIEELSGAPVKTTPSERPEDLKTKARPRVVASATGTSKVGDGGGGILRKIADLGEKNKKSEFGRTALSGYLIERLAKGLPLVTEQDPSDLQDTSKEDIIDRTFRALGSGLPKSVPWQDVLKAATPSLLAFDPHGFFQSKERVEKAMQSFLYGRGGREKRKERRYEQNQLRASERWDALRDTARS